MENKMIEGSIHLIGYVVYGLITLVVGLVMYFQKRIVGNAKELEDRLRYIEIHHISHEEARQLIHDAVDPIKASQDEIKTDVKEILKYARKA